MTTTSFLPGCYANLPAATGESLPGYLLRLANANGYSGIRDLLSTLRGPSTRGAGQAIRTLRMSKTMLADLGRMAVGDEKHCLHFLATPAGDNAAIVQGMRIDHDAWLEPAAQLCPLCLQDKTVVPEDWDLGCVTACERHKVQLLDACACCGEPITWDRASLLHCPSCGSDYRDQQAQNASEEVLVVSGDFSAMARFRYRTHEKEPTTGSWGMGFELFKLMSLSAFHWAKDLYPTVHVQQLSIADRALATKKLAVARVGHVYELPRLAPQIADMLAPLRVFPRPHVLERFAQHYVAAHCSLTPEIYGALVSVDPIPEPVPGHELFAGRPPSLHGSEAAMHFLGIDNLTHAGLVFWGAIPTPPADEPYDIDDLLGAQRFLTEELLTMAEQQSIMGVPLLDEPGPHEMVMIPWNRRNQTDRRIPLRNFVPVHLHLLSRWNRQTAPQDPVTLRELAMTTLHPIGTVCRAINLIVNGAITSFNWKAPYRWADVVVERDASLLILQGAQVAQR